MSFTVYHGAADISSYVIDYQRQKRICNGIGECTLTLSKSYATAINPYNEIIIWENGVKKGTYFVAEVTQTLPDYSIQIKAQDITKQLSDYFISDYYEITYPSTSKYWIEKFLVEAGITYHFIGSEVGHQMSLNTWVGNENVYDLVQRLCMENGWYFLADKDNELEIGKLLIDYDAIVQSVQDDDITDLTYNKDDKMLRNRVIVRGNADYLTQIWVTGEVKVITPWNYDSNDYRTAVLMSPDIPDVGVANQLANQVLAETRKITEVKAVECNDFINAECGDCLYVQSEFWNGVGLITTFMTKVNKSDGAKTVAILDERCPRLFGYYAGTGDVYIGTEGDGVWRKPLKFVHDWEDYSQGLQSLNVTDLSVANGVKSCIANGELYVRTPLNTSWIRELPQITVSGIPSLDPYCMDTVVTRNDSTVEAIYADVLTVSGENRSFLVTHTVSGLFDIIPITVSGMENIYAYGMDHDGKDTYISVMEYIMVSGMGDNHAEQEELGGLHVTNSISDALSDSTTGLVSSHYAYNTDWQVNSITTIPEENNILLPVVGTRIAVGKYVYWLDSDGTHVIKYNYKNNINYTVATSVSGSRYARYLHVYNENITIGTDHDFLEADSKYTFEFEVNDFSTNSSTRYRLDYFDISFCQRQYVQNTRGSVMIQNKLIMFYTIKGGLYYKIYNPENNTLSDRYSVFIPATYYDEYLTLEIRCVLGTKVYGDLLYWGDDWEPAGNPHQLTFCVDIGGANVVLTDDDLTPQIADYSSGYVIGTRLGKFIRINNDLTISDIANFPVGGTDICFVGSKNKVYYLNSFGGNARIYEIGAASCTLLVSGVDYANIARNADDVDDGILILNNSDDLIKYTFPGGVSTTEQVFSSITPEHTNFIFLFGERISVGRYLLWSNASDGISAQQAYSLLKYDGTSFERKLWLTELRKVDTAQQMPVIMFGGDPVFNSGGLDIWYQNEINPTYIFASGYVSDARSAMLLTTSGLSPVGFFCINPPSGSNTSDLMYTDFSNTLTSGYEWGGYFIIGGYIGWSPEMHQYSLANYHTFSGIVNHVETSNFSYDEPFILTSVTISGVDSFYQKDGRMLDEPETEFIVRNNFLPDSKINCVRLDERV